MSVEHRIGALALLVLATAQPAWAQVRDLDSAQPDGRVFVGAYGSSDRPAAFQLTLRADQAIEVEAAAGDGSDPMLKVFEADSGRLIAENDDAPGGLSARVRLYSPADMKLRLEVSDVLGAGGRYRLTVVPTDYRPNPVREIAQGQRHGGNLGPGEEQLFHIRSRGAGEAWDLVLANEGSELDPYLSIFAGDVPVGSPLATDDDGADGLNARLRFVTPGPGTFTVRASGVGSSGGDYVFTASQGVPPRPAETLEVALGRMVRGTLSGDPPQQMYRLSDGARTAIARGGVSALVVEMTAPADGSLDPVVEVGFETPLGFFAVARDDDGGGGTNARLSLDLAQLSGSADWLNSLRIRATSFAGEGDFELTVTGEAR